MKNGKLGLYLEQRQDVVIKDPSRINYCSAQNSFKMALVITVAADVEPDQVSNLQNQLAEQMSY